MTTPDLTQPEPSAAEVIAVVDDDPAIVHALMAWLGLAGFRSRGFGSAEGLMQAVTLDSVRGDDGIRFADAPGDRLRAAVLDVMLPGLSGVELARRLRDADCRLALVLISASRVDQRGHLGDVPDGVACLDKPFDLGVMAKALSSALRVSIASI